MQFTIQLTGGIKPTSVPAFVAAQLVGAVVAVALIRTLYPDIADAAEDVLVPHAA